MNLFDQPIFTVIEENELIMLTKLMKFRNKVLYNKLMELWSKIDSNYVSEHVLKLDLRKKTVDFKKRVEAT